MGLVPIQQTSIAVPQESSQNHWPALLTQYPHTFAVNDVLPDTGRAWKHSCTPHRARHRAAERRKYLLTRETKATNPSYKAVAGEASAPLQMAWRCLGLGKGTAWQGALDGSWQRRRNCSNSALEWTDLGRIAHGKRTAGDRSDPP